MLSKLELRFSGNDQEILCALKNMYNSETPEKESFSHIAKFYNNDGEILEAEQKMRLHDCFRNARVALQENEFFDIFPEFSEVVHILAVIYLLHHVQQSDHSVRCTE